MKYNINITLSYIATVILLILGSDANAQDQRTDDLGQIMKDVLVEVQNMSLAGGGEPGSAPEPGSNTTIQCGEYSLKKHTISGIMGIGVHVDEEIAKALAENNCIVKKLQAVLDCQNLIKAYQSICTAAPEGCLCSGTDLNEAGSNCEPQKVGEQGGLFTYKASGGTISCATTCRRSKIMKKVFES